MSVTVVNEWRFRAGAELTEAMSAIREDMVYLNSEEAELEQSLWVEDRDDPLHYFHIATDGTPEALERQYRSPGPSRFVERLYPLIDDDSLSQPVGDVVANSGQGPGEI